MKGRTVRYNVFFDAVEIKENRRCGIVLEKTI